VRADAPAIFKKSRRLVVISSPLPEQYGS
jgi:hypothetical protein